MCYAMSLINLILLGGNVAEYCNKAVLPYELWVYPHTGAVVMLGVGSMLPLPTNVRIGLPIKQQCNLLFHSLSHVVFLLIDIPSMLGIMEIGSDQ